MIAPPKFSNVDICLEEFLYFLEDIGALKTAISVDDVGSLHSAAIFDEFRVMLKRPFM